MTELWMLTMSPPRMATAAIPRIATAMTSSIRVSPLSLRCGVRRLDMSYTDLTEDPVHRGDQRHRDEAHDQPHHDDDERLEQCRELGDLVVELGLVVLRGDLELGVERAGVLADAQHLRRRRREEPGARQRTGDALTLEDLLPHLAEPLDVDPVP